MKASIVDLRYKSADILKALEKNESVTILYHGKVKGVISPAGKKIMSKVSEHPFFGMKSSTGKSVDREMEALRKPRYDV